jgi:hypothetical protein
VLFYLREVSEGKGDMDPHNAFCSSHFPERVDGNWLTGESVRVSMWGAHGILWFWVGRRMGRRRDGGKGGRRGREGWKEGQGKGGRRGAGKRGSRSGGQRLNNPILKRWRLISRVKRREHFGIRRRLGRGFGWV